MKAMAGGMYIALIPVLFCTTVDALGPFVREDYVVPKDTPTVTVNTKYGLVEGFKVRKPEYSANLFVRLPYATPPINDLKLEKPEPVEPWEGILQAKRWPLPCAPQSATVAEWSMNVSENCLYLNIFTPSTPPPDGELYPVAVWIHGGGFSFGDTQTYGYEGFVKNYVSKGIVIVTVQYRLGPFGYFSTGDHFAPGNLGLWDQRQALLFLHDVLKNFGGDKNKITVFGHSAGAASTSLLAASPHSRDLFAQAYQLSGSAMLEWGNSEGVVQVSKDLAKLLNCPDTTCPVTLKNCVKSKSTEEILVASDKMGLSRNALNTLYWQPYIKTDWITDDYHDELAKAPPKPTLIGLTSSEAYLTTISTDEIFAKMFSVHHGIPKEKQHLQWGCHIIMHTTVFTKQDLIDAIHEKFATVAVFGQYAEEAAKDLKMFYALDNHEENPTFYFSQYSQLFSDIHFIVNVIEEALDKADKGWPTYVYLFDWANPKIADKGGFFDGAPHGMELAYLLDVFIFGDYEFDEEDHKIKKTLVDGVTNFIKTGNPSSSEEYWPRLPASKVPSFPYTFLGKRAHRAESFFKSKLLFWRIFIEKYHYNLILGLYKQAEKIKDEF